MKVLYFSRDYTTHDHRFLSFLADGEHDIGFLRLEQRRLSMESRSLPLGVRHFHWKNEIEKSGWKQCFRWFTNLRSVIREFKPDLILAGPVQRSAFLVALSGFHPLITMSWGYDLLVDASKGKLWEWATRFTLRRSDAFVGDCDTIRKRAIAFGMSEDRIITFPWGADIRKFTPVDEKWETVLRKRLGWDKSNFVLLSTRTWSDIYGVEDLAKAYVDIVKSYPEVRLMMLGNGPLAPLIHKIFDREKVLDSVHLPGQVSQDELPEYYRSADLYISTSHSDGTSISMLEALATGTPVLLTDIPGNAEWVNQPGVVGWLFQDGDVESLKTGIQLALDNRESLPRIGRNARELAQVRGDWEKNAKYLYDAFRIALR